MNTQKYQKSTLKILDFLLREADKEFIIEDLIQATRVGRSAAFLALRQLDQDSFIRLSLNGKQKQVRLIPSRENLSLKLFFDGFRFQSLPREIKLPLALFISSINLPASIVLFGSSLAKPKPQSDLDMLIFSKEEVEKDALKKVKEEMERIGGKTINLHFTSCPEIEILLNGICLHNYDFYLETLENRLDENRRRTKEKMLQSAKWCSSLFHNLSEPDFADILGKVLTEFSFFYSFLHSRFGLSKEEAKTFFYSSQYKKDLKSLEKTKDNFKKFEIIKLIFQKLGEKFV
ncbi:nucleotidyltransferase domain-containing protein [Candidatus Woesearchaeota archaeon]|nr:nucleotidyltransferase domain-containing protein [Candidatus Woesearchaeota archaeon]